MVTSIYRMLVCVMIGIGAVNCLAADHFYSVDINGIEFKNGKLPKASMAEGIDFRRAQVMRPYVALENAGEAYVVGAGRWQPAVIEGQGPVGPRLLVKSSVDKDVSGSLFWPKSDFSGYVKLRFDLPKSAANIVHRIAFLEAKLDHYETQMSSQVSGTAWFRHQMDQTAVNLKKEVPQSPDNQRVFGNRGNEVSETFALFSGGRALSENLQLDRQLPTSKPEKETVALDSIKGVTVHELAWGPALKEEDPALDYLARNIPQDQYVIFFPSFQAMVSLADEASEQGAPVLTLAEPRGENAMVQERYERQLCLKLDAGARLLGSTVIKSVAMTGSDPYFRTGTDVAVLFQAKSPEIFRKFVDTQMATRGGKYKTARPVQGEFMEVPYTGMRSPDRVICSYSATLDKTVVVTNSLVQLKRLILTHHKNSLSLAVLPEFKFFRQRYPLGDEKESAFLVISDPTIRRWCGPKWRIGSSRRTRAAATIAEMQALHLDALANKQAKGELVTVDPSLPEAGVLSLTANGVSSAVYGSLGFQTPIAELSFTHVSPEEARLYAQWRDGYQRYWSNFFDPIAVRFQVNKSRISADVSVIPLIDSSDYQQFIDVAKGVELRSDFGDPHPESILHWALAINTDSEVLRQNTNLLQSIAPQIKISPLSWIGNGVAAYVDQDPLWMDFSKAVQAADGNVEKVIEEFMESQVHRLPVAIHVDVKNGLKLTLFLAAIRGFVETTVPGMLNWETLKYREQSYVKVSPTAEARRALDELPDIALYYSASGEALIATLNGNLIERAIDRRLARRENDDKEQPKQDEPNSANPDEHWLGESMGLQVKKDLVMLMEQGLKRGYRRAMQRLSWGNLPILNEWKRRYPQSDPVALHERLWERRLVCPGGGMYVWNDEWQTMESTIFGHPGIPKPGKGLPQQLKDIKSANFGVTFEHIEAIGENGLRARLELTR